MKRFLSVSAICALFFLTSNSNAQQTGSFTEQINFNNQPRNLAIFVPSGYDASAPCKLVIGLHGMGDNANNYRNALVNSLSFAAAFPNTILVCPDGGNDNARSFHIPVGDEEIIEESIQFIMNNYAIDTTQILLQGFSLGGYSALRYGLDHPQKFKGLLLNTPAIQGVKEATNRSEAVVIAYENVADLPIFITIGNQDDLYIAPIDSAAVKLVEQNALLNYRTFNGGHTVPAFTNYEYLTFFDNPYSNGADARISKVVLPVRSCSANVVPSILVQNKGADTIKNLKFSYGTGAMVNQEWTGSLSGGAHAYIALNSYTFSSEGNHTFQVKIDSVDHLADLTAYDNTSTKDIQIQSATSSMPYYMSFEDESFWNTWASAPSGDYILPWEYDEETKTLISFNSIFIFDNAGTREEIKTPEFDLSSASQAYLHFTTDYNFTQYSAAVFGVDTVFADTLEVFASIDCGDNYTKIFQKGGSDLSGHDAPVQDPLNLQSVFLDNDPSKNVLHSLDVSAFASHPQVHFKFSYTSHLGGYIYLDNVELTNSPTDVRTVTLADLNIYPNPAKEVLYIQMKDGAKIQQVSIYDQMGRSVGVQQGLEKGAVQVNTSKLPAGVYSFSIITERGTLNKKIMVQP